MTDHPRGPGDPAGAGGPEVGSLGEEAARLFGALADWSREQGGQAGAAAADSAAGLAGHAARFASHVDAQSSDEQPATGSAECTWCPICRTVHSVRQLSPEVRAHLATAAASLAQAAAGILATAVPDGSAPDGSTPEGAGRPHRPHRSDHVERIRLDETVADQQGGPDPEDGV